MLKLLLERTEKLFVSDEDYAEKIVEEAKANTEETLVDYKVSYKTTKDSEYYIVTLKFRKMTLNEAKDQI
jgi:ElaB/YqjD/DUF883 family membrane-anchored ribosome-binding protein